MNKESLPLIIGILIPAFLVLLVLLRFYGFDIIEYLLQFDIKYYIILLPIVLGFIVVIVKWLRPD